MEFENLHPDDYYYAEYSTPNEWVIVKGTIDSRPNLFISEKQNNFWMINKCEAKHNIRLATPQEIHWLDCCISNARFIDFNEAMLTYVESINFQQDSEYNNLLIKLLTQ